MKNGTKSANRLEVHCPACTKRLRAVDQGALRERVKRHLPNCPAMKRIEEPAPVPEATP